VRDLAAQQRAELLGRAATDVGPKLGERFADLFGLQRFIQRCIQTRGHGRRGSRFHQDAGPVFGHEIGVTRFDDGRHVFECLDALSAGDGQRAELAGIDELHHRQDRDELVRIHATDQVADRLRELDIGHVRHLYSGLELEELTDQVRGGAETAGRERVLSRVALQIGDQLGHRMNRYLRIDHQHVVCGADADQGCKISLKVERCVGLQPGQRGDRRGNAQQRVPVGGLLQHVAGTEHHHRPGLVLDNDVPAFAVGQRAGNDAREDVRRCADRPRDDGANDV
jgi:hypothetical protein